MEPVLDCALGALEDGAVDPAALCELASGAVPGVLVAGCWLLALWSLCGMVLPEGAEEDPLVPDALCSGVVLLVPAALCSGVELLVLDAV